MDRKHYTSSKEIEQSDSLMDRKHYTSAKEN